MPQNLYFFVNFVILFFLDKKCYFVHNVEFDFCMKNNSYIIHILTDSGYIFLCMALKRFGNRKPFAYLSSIRDRFVAQFPNAKKSATHMALQRDFKSTLKNQVKAFEQDKLSTVHNQLDEVKGIMVQNIDKVLERGNRIEVLMEAADDLGTSADHFRMKSTKLKNAMWRRNLALLCVLVAIIVVVVIVVVWLACGLTFHGCTSIFIKKDDDQPKE